MNSAKDFEYDASKELRGLVPQKTTRMKRSVFTRRFVDLNKNELLII